MGTTTLVSTGVPATPRQLWSWVLAASALLVSVQPARALDEPGVVPARLGDLSGPSYRSERAPFFVSVDGRLIPWKVMALPVLPEQRVRLRTSSSEAAVTSPDMGSLHPAREGEWVWTAPTEPGIEAVRIEDGRGGFVHLNFLVMRARTEVAAGSLDGYRIGTYHADPDPESAYAAPVGFVEVRPDDEDVLLSPHFTLGQFLCKQPGEPRFAVVSFELMLKLEAVLEALNEAGIDAPTLHVMSGFRTPWYNRAIGNKTTRSRHLWGDAADVWVDADGNGEMDDLNRDGRVNLDDARTLARIVERVERDRLSGVRVGGLGLYKRNSVHGPFVHVDARGHSARW